MVVGFVFQFRLNFHDMQRREDEKKRRKPFLGSADAKRNEEEDDTHVGLVVFKWVSVGPNNLNS